MEKAYAMYGDRTGRTRMSQDGKSLKVPYIARGQCIVTAETTPAVAQSRIARSITVPMKADSVNLQKLTFLQNNTNKLAFSMMKYIEWIIQNETRIRDFVKTKFNELRNKQNNDLHGRTVENLNVLTIGFNLFTQFLVEKDIIKEDRKIELDAEASTILSKLVEQQTQEIIELKPTEMFYDALEQLFATKSIQLLDYKTGEPAEDISEGGSIVGFYDREQKLYYFYPDVIFNTIEKFCSGTDRKFPINARALWKYLDEEGSLYRTDKKRYSIQRKIDGKQYTVVAVRPREKEYSLDEPSVTWNKFKPSKFFKNFESF